MDNVQDRGRSERKGHFPMPLVSIRHWLGQRPSLQKIISNSGWLFADRMLRLGVGLFVGVWVARYLGPEKYGLYSFSAAFVALFSGLATLGLDNIVVRDLVHKPNIENTTLGTAFVLKLTGGIVAFLLTATLIRFFRSGDIEAQWMVTIIALGTVFQSLDMIDYWFQSRVQSKFTVYARSTAFILISLAKVILILAHAPLIAFAFPAFGEIALGALGLGFMYHKRGGRYREWNVSLSRAKELLKVSWPLIFSTLAIMTYMKIDQIMISGMVGDKALGIYSAATRVSELTYFVPTVIVSSVLPSIVTAKKISAQLYHRRLEQLFDLVAGLALLIAIFVTIFSSKIISVLYGDKYHGSGPILAIHIWTVLFVYLGVAQLPWDAIEGLTLLALRRTSIGALVNVTMNLLLIPTLAGIGAAISILVSQAISAFFGNLLDKRTRPIFVLQGGSLNILKYFRRFVRANVQ